uniref:chorismate-binding protein n=1 Tax=Candidatus Magnetaquicoccus inordinatus TaxID=2496818 RepID=UPI00102AA7B0
MILPLTPDLLHSGTNLLFDFVGLPSPLFLQQPLTCLHTKQPEEVVPLLHQAEEAARSGHWVGGFLTYEAAAAFDLPVYNPGPLPLLWLAICRHAQAAALLPPPQWLPPTLTLTCAPSRYAEDLQTILEHIARGDSYQVNYTLSGQLGACNPASLFLALQSSHRHPYAAWINWQDLQIASLSPELLLQRQGQQLLTAPIKGTSARFLDPQQDARVGQEMADSPKERAEHVMIVDMARNDLGRVCESGSIHVEQLFARRLFASVQHLESRVYGRQRAALTWPQLMRSLFPAASITGAPKYRTMEIIRQLEQRPRGIYTGSLFLLQPGGDLISNVAIRTCCWQHNQAGEIGLGGGIVADSQVAREWQELADKSRFLHQLPPELLLIETLLLQADGTLRDATAHWQRLQASAQALGFVCDREQLAQQLQQQLAEWRQEQAEEWIVRVSLSAAGQVTLQRRRRPTPLCHLQVQLAAQAVDRLDR